MLELAHAAPRQQRYDRRIERHAQLLPHGLDARKLGQQIRWVTNVPKPLALATDACGNVYSVGNQDGRLRRISVDGKVTVIAELAGRNIWALNFGSGKHGFAADALYALDKNTGSLYEIKVGVGETPSPTVVP